MKAYRSKFDLTMKKVKVNPRSSFEQILLGPSPQCCIPSPKVIGPLVPEKKGFHHGGHLGHVTQTPPNKLSFPRPMEAPYEIWLWLVLIGPVVLEKKMFENGGRRWRRTDDRACLYYKLTYEPKGLGELKAISRCIYVENEFKKGLGALWMPIRSNVWYPRFRDLENYSWT